MSHGPHVPDEVVRRSGIDDLEYIHNQKIQQDHHVGMTDLDSRGSSLELVGGHRSPSACHLVYY